MAEFTGPDPLANMAAIAVAPLNPNGAFMSGAQAMGDMIVDAIAALGQKLGGAVMNGVAKVGNMAAGAALAATSATVPFKPDFSPSASLQTASTNAVSNARGQERQISGEAMLGALTAPSTPSQGIQQGQSMAMC